MTFFTPNTQFFSNYIDKGKYTLIWRLSILFIIIFFLLTVFSFFYDKQSSAIYSAVCIIAAGGFLYLKKTKKYQHIFWSFAVSATIIDLISLSLDMEIVHYGDFFWIFAIVIFAFVGLGRKVAIFLSCVLSLGVAYHMLFKVNSQIEMLRPHSLPEQIGVLVELLFSLFAVAYLLQQYMVFQTYSEKQLIIANTELGVQNELIQKKGEENAVLVKEVHHRVKNNLQIVISLLRMQREELDSEETKKQFTEAIRRIMSMALIHQKLYSENELAQINLKTYIEQLIREIIYSSESDKVAIVPQVKVEIQLVGLDTVVPLGLLINEFVTNSMKHAFNNQSEGEITVAIIPYKEKGFKLNYCDSGTWSDFAEKSTGFGQELIELLVMQLNGTIVRTESCFELLLDEYDH